MEFPIVDATRGADNPDARPRRTVGEMTVLVAVLLLVMAVSVAIVGSVVLWWVAATEVAWRTVFG